MATLKTIIKYVFWDFGDTLVGLKPDILHKFIDIIFQHCNRRISVANLEKAMRDEWGRRGQKDEWEKNQESRYPRNGTRILCRFLSRYITQVRDRKMCLTYANI